MLQRLICVPVFPLVIDSDLKSEISSNEIPSDWFSYRFRRASTTSAITIWPPDDVLLLTARTSSLIDGAHRAIARLPDFRSSPLFTFIRGSRFWIDETCPKSLDRSP